jgi:hypothetical protein
LIDIPSGRGGLFDVTLTENEYGGVPPVTPIVQPAYAVPCVPSGQDVVVTVSAPWVPPLELLVEEELLLLEEAPLDDELLLDDELPPDDELLLDEGSELALLLPPPQPVPARQATNTNSPSAVRRITPVHKWQRQSGKLQRL